MFLFVEWFMPAGALAAQHVTHVLLLVLLHDQHQFIIIGVACLFSVKAETFLRLL